MTSLPTETVTSVSQKQAQNGKAMLVFSVTFRRHLLVSNNGSKGCNVLKKDGFG
jgi:hypothetical protein